ncbi:MAG: hypothetical protein IT429_22905 [Gemmataceae bacterium]|nr:hypothetical protein [Gemmataceae bacterium]
MRKISFALAAGAAALSLWICTPGTGQAQVFSSDEIERGLRVGPRVPWDGEGLMHRYNYRPGAVLYLNGNPGYLNMMDYLDRLDRAEKFGYRRPPDPFRRPPIIYYRESVPCNPPPPVYYYRN